MKQLNFSAHTTAADNLRAVILVVIILFFPLGAGHLFAQTWTPKANTPPAGRTDAAGFSIGNKGYIGTGYSGSTSAMSDFWEWDQASNVWTQKADFGGGKRIFATGLSIGSNGKGYIGGGGIPCDFWEWDQATNVWVRRADLNGTPRTNAVGFSIGAKGYIGTGYGSGTTGSYNDFWEWDQASDIWTQKANFGGTPRYDAVGFSIGTKGYIGTGFDGNTAGCADFWEWNQSTNIWTQKANLPGSGRLTAVGFSIGNKGYIGTGETKNNTKLKDFWQWDQATNTWVQMPDYGGAPVSNAVGFSIGNYGYIGTGAAGGGKENPSNEFWEFCPTCPPLCALSANIFSNVATLCIGSNAVISASGGTNYLWNTGATSASVTVSPSIITTYSVIVSDANGCKDTVAITIPVKNCCSVSPAINSDPSPNTTFCVGQNVYLSASGGASYAWSTGETGANIAATLSVTTTYSVTVTDANGCTGTSSTTFIVDPNCTTTGISQIYGSSLLPAIRPNPSNGIFTMDMAHGIAADAGIEIFNVFGEKIYQSAVSGRPQSIDISGQPKGIYVLKLTWGKETSFAKIIIRQ